MSNDQIYFMLIDILGLGDTAFAVAVILALVIVIAIWYNIIQSATKSRSILKLQRMQVEILKEIAIINGVPADKIDGIISEHNV